VLFYIYSRYCHYICYFIYSDKVQQNPVKAVNTMRQRRHSLSCEQDLPVGGTTHLNWKKWMTMKEAENQAPAIKIRKELEKKVTQLTRQIELKQANEDETKEVNEKHLEYGKKIADLEQDIERLAKERKEVEDKNNILEQKIKGQTVEFRSYSYLDDDSRKKLISSIDSTMTLCAKRLAEHPDLSIHVLLSLMRDNIDLFSKISWSYFDDDSRKKLISSIDSTMTIVNQQLLKYTDNSECDLLPDVIRMCTEILQKTNWSDFNQDVRDKTISCLKDMMDLLSQKLPQSTIRNDLLKDTACIILAMISVLPPSSGIIPQLRSQLTNMITAVEKTLSLSSTSGYKLDEVIEMNKRLTDMLPRMPTSPEATSTLLSLIDSTNKLLMLGIKSRKDEPMHSRYHFETLQYSVRDLIDKLPLTLPATSDVLIKVLSILESVPYESRSSDYDNLLEFTRRLQAQMMAHVSHLKKRLVFFHV
jgi:hypothetical protein